MNDDAYNLGTELTAALIGGGERRNAVLSGIKGLLLAVLEDGIRSYLSPVAEVRGEAEYWVGSGRTRSPFAFVVICETLGLEPSAVRAALERMRAQQIDASRAIGRTRPNVRRAHRVTQRQAG